jgi:hypothetical protein
MNATVQDEIRVRQREPAVRNRPLLDLCHDAPCFLLFEGCRSGHPDWPSVPCHPESLALGRGHGSKSPDNLAIPGCPVCHAQWDRMPAQEHFDVWCRAFPRWDSYRWRMGLVRVA